MLVSSFFYYSSRQERLAWRKCPSASGEQQLRMHMSNMFHTIVARYLVSIGNRSGEGSSSSANLQFESNSGRLL